MLNHESRSVVCYACLPSVFSSHFNSVFTIHFRIGIKIVVKIRIMQCTRFFRWKHLRIIERKEIVQIFFVRQSNGIIVYRNNLLESIHAITRSKSWTHTNNKTNFKADYVVNRRRPKIRCCFLKLHLNALFIATLTS